MFSFFAPPKIAHLNVSQSSKIDGIIMYRAE